MNTPRHNALFLSAMQTLQESARRPTRRIWVSLAEFKAMSKSEIEEIEKRGCKVCIDLFKPSPAELNAEYQKDYDEERRDGWAVGEIES